VSNLTVRSSYAFADNLEGIGRIAEARALRGSEPVGSSHGLSEDRDLEHGWLLENPSGSKGIFEIGYEERLCCGAEVRILTTG
jgi:hypothetical protein